MTDETFYEGDDEECCENCGNIFRVILLKKSEDYNDFGYRHCPFCGMLTDEYAHLAIVVEPDATDLYCQDCKMIVMQNPLTMLGLI